MLYNELNHTLSFTEVLDTNSDEADIVPTTDNVKSVNIDDIAEIRPGILIIHSHCPNSYIIA
jgi:hypothetical protein